MRKSDFSLTYSNILSATGYLLSFTPWELGDVAVVDLVPDLSPLWNSRIRSFK